ncbi:DCN1-like protein 2 isoform X1 [Lagenorhynchus albirostris]|uniref:DCN1-like protein 2 isoform X1 n=1 Tax=Lagenorhynchus albirostris TaxID=27610 RepID=UPI0028EE4739|nr:DCN1-like protein 2 isoform X1 [Lagenorhynchus albirostris]XP_059984725.1 DCN1-like protein 2 isoform X1 [Lagenorhynchus albirostris]XP_059984726.1 DCN1-like protein 2 isoform X1 [Lagenorhynchus albirostris]XP_059984727.1 DCN1-like protein 2 isoform X1 [Lagenorhynchus albirostris]XP_059984728.1 DCN1-like protein 2 isoform X1 [Lagenorhynchus albirostris]XP_059984729.1 DCN1-like protein 2 isoform X1 [Lagenorhynchus albirostris]XP_059984730.1 DCN1-like protein 2 isoform X1 [Lagenorhynchus alb
MSRRVGGPLTAVASPIAEHRLQTRRLSGHGSRAQPLRGMWDPPGPGHEPASPASAGGLSTTAPPGKPTNLEMAVAYWNLVFSGRLKFLDLWNILLLGLAQKSPSSRPAATLCHQLKAAPRGSAPAAPRLRPLDCPPAAPPQLCSRAGATPDVLCIAREEWGAQLAPGGRVLRAGVSAAAAGSVQGAGRPDLGRWPCCPAQAPTACEEQPFHRVVGWGLCGKALLEQPGEGPQNATRQRDTGLTWDGRCRRAHCAGHARVLRCETSWQAVCEPCACDVCRRAHSGTCCLMSWEPLGDKGEAGPGPGLPVELRAGTLHVFAAPEVPRNYRGISGKVSHTTSKNSPVFRKINVSKYYLPALFLNWFGA